MSIVQPTRHFDPYLLDKILLWLVYGKDSEKNSLISKFFFEIEVIVEKDVSSNNCFINFKKNHFLCVDVCTHVIEKKTKTIMKVQSNIHEDLDSAQDIFSVILIFLYFFVIFVKVTLQRVL